ncbi:hypothetical protein K435DRAFT_870309 [Dendrothele bispora CBS 962.96]|uniref:HMG box domain-containing protein n=1 Tax=Dendrothele bispora (strain CBS 962.96) TaxID=1314807 RepID=A0A4S8L890_DENBC|nr:hypothetical protein K435DRAFT_870309 [Dendrothele bispora CBS 962.96]
MLALRNRDIQRVPSRSPEASKGYAKRFENAFFLFRRKWLEDHRPNLDLASEAISPAKKRRRVHLSRIIAEQWKSLSAEERQYWECLAKEKKKRQPKNSTQDTVPATRPLTSDNENAADSYPNAGPSRNLNDINVRYVEQDNREVGRSVENWGDYREVNHTVTCESK